MMLKLAIRRLQNRGPAYVARSTQSFTSSVFAQSPMSTAFDAYTSNGLVFQIVSRQATAAAEAVWGLYPKSARDVSEAIQDHPAAILWARPNPFMDSNEFVEMSVQHFLLAGECDWKTGTETEINGRRITIPGGPVELWPVRPDRLEPETDALRFLEGWAYRNPEGKWEPWKVSDVIQTKQPDPRNPYRGLGAIAAVMADLYSDRAATEYQNAFFRNDGSAGDIIRFPERLSDEQFDEFVERWNQQHQGTSNANKIGFIEVAEYIERKNNMRDMQFVEGRKQTREFVREGFGYPVAMLGTTEDVNKAAAQAAELIFKNRMIRPLLARIQTTLNTKLLPMFRESEDLEFRFKTPDIADEELALEQEKAKFGFLGELVRAGFDPEKSLAMLGIQAVPHIGLPPVTVQPKYLIDRAGQPGAAAGVAPPTEGSRRASDPGARATWEHAQRLRAESPRTSWDVIAGLVGVDRSTLYRYRAEFEAEN